MKCREFGRLGYSRRSSDRIESMWRLPGDPVPREQLIRENQRALAKAEARQREQLAQFERMRQPAVHHHDAASQIQALRDDQSRYANTILLLAYGGFYALWASTAGNMPKSWFGLSGILMGISLLFFIGFELAKMIAKSVAFRKGLAVDEHGHKRVADYEVLFAVSSNIDRVNSYWLPVFIPTLLTGLAAGLIVLFFFAANAMRGEWTYPPPPTEKSAQESAPSRASTTDIQKNNDPKSLENKDSAAN